MPIEFDNTLNQRVQFGSVSILDNINDKLISYWMYLDSFNGGTNPYITISKTDDLGVGWNIYILTGSERVGYLHSFDGTSGIWASNASTIAIETVYHVAVEYDRTNVANNPRIWINGVLQTSNELSTPVGTTTNDTGNSLEIAGGYFDGWISNPRIYNLAGFSSTEIDALVSDLYNGKLYDANDRGILFNCHTLGASGLQTFEGATLTDSNLLIDSINGLQGTPNGSPEGRGETILHSGMQSWQEGRGGS